MGSMPWLQKRVGFRVKAPRVKLYRRYRDPLVTPNLEFSHFPEG